MRLTPTPARLTLMVSHRGQILAVPLDHGSVVTIGRGEDNHLVLSGDSSVSRQHARLGWDTRLWVEDLGSFNGTRVRTRPTGADGEDTHSLAVRESRSSREEVGPGAIVEIGTAMITIHDEEEPPLPPASGAAPLVLDPRMVHVYRIAEQIALTDLNVILLGESGSGKEVLAQHIHQLSPRRTGPLVTLNCGALADTLVEAELFGYERGAFTGANRAKPGLFEAAHGGTLLLDEIGELAQPLQVKLLRVLEERTTTRIGAMTPRASDVRVLAATNRDLAADVEVGRFRLDLFHRLDGICLTLPPLRERPAEISALAQRFMAQAAARSGNRTPSLTAQAEHAMIHHPWPGNVRELKNAIERTMVVSAGRPIEEEHLGLLRPRASASTAPGAAALGVSPALAPAAAAAAEPLRARDTDPEALRARDTDPEALRARAEDLESARVEEALAACAGNQTRAAELLGLSRRALVRRLEKFAVPRPRRRGPA
jgi:two-component system, NtrC family, response regulator AtoC